MAALGATNPTNWIVPKTAIKKFVGSFVAFPLYHVKTKSKNPFYGSKQIQKIAKIRTSVWRAALCAASRKKNGRRRAPPTKKSEKFLKIKLWSIFMTSLELILSKMSEKIHCPPRRAGRAGKPLGSRAKNFRGLKLLKPLHFCPLAKRLAKNLIK